MVSSWKSRFVDPRTKRSRTVSLFVAGALFVIPRRQRNSSIASEKEAIACAAFSVEAVDPTHLFDDDDRGKGGAQSGREPSVYERPTNRRLLASFRESHSLPRGRRHLLLDTYGESLTRVNRLYTKRYGKPGYNQVRRVPAHMPHMIDTRIITEMQNEWPNEWLETARNRFRSGTDMQVSLPVRKRGDYLSLTSRAVCFRIFSLHN